MNVRFLSGNLHLEAESGGFCTSLQDRTSPASTLSQPVLGLSTLTGETQSHAWITHILPVANGFWLNTTLTVAETIALNPSMILWLGKLDNLNDRQAHTWRQTVLRAPTMNQQGLPGNDLMACYLYDHEQSLETICYYPASAFTWAPSRFYSFTARDVLQYHPEARYGLGLIPNSPDVNFTFTPGEYQFRWWFTQSARTTIPSTWEAQRRLIAAITPLLDVVPHQPINLEPERPLLIPPWPDFARNTLIDLQNDACWTAPFAADSPIQGLRAYVRGSSAVARDEASGFELMTQLDVLWPLMLWREVSGEKKADLLIERLLETLPHFDRPQFNFVANGFPLRDGDSFMDTWYFLENALIKLPWIAYLTGDAALKAMFFRALEGAKTLAKHTDYLFPLFADASDWSGRNSLLNVGVGGLYAAGCVIAHQLSADAEASYLQEAAHALNVLRQLPPHQLTHEPQQLSFGSAAANYLANVGLGEDWRIFAGDLVRLSLRMGYWDSDPATPFYDPRGMFQACASLCYPAYKENVETIQAWPELLRDETHHAAFPTELMAAFANLQRCHNYKFFDAWLPTDLRRGPCPAIPYEDLATAEFTHTAKLGKELYGAGEVFWSALMFAADMDVRWGALDILCLWLDVPCVELRRPASNNRRFLLYNPLPSAREIDLYKRDGTPITTIMFSGREMQTIHISG